MLDINIYVLIIFLKGKYQLLSSFTKIILEYLNCSKIIDIYKKYQIQDLNYSNKFFILFMN